MGSSCWILNLHLSYWGKKIYPEGLVKWLLSWICRNRCCRGTANSQLFLSRKPALVGVDPSCLLPQHRSHMEWLTAHNLLLSGPSDYWFGLLYMNIEVNQMHSTRDTGI